MDANELRRIQRAQELFERASPQNPFARKMKQDAVVLRLDPLNLAHRNEADPILVLHADAGGIHGLGRDPRAHTIALLAPNPASASTHQRPRAADGLAQPILSILLGVIDVGVMIDGTD